MIMVHFYFQMLNPTRSRMSTEGHNDYGPITGDMVVTVEIPISWDKVSRLP